jgi:hypothetical protein
LRATLPAWKIKLAIGYTLKGKEFIRRRKSNKIKSSRREPSVFTPFLCCSVFCVREEPILGANDKAFRPSSNDFSLFLWHLFLRRTTHKTPAAEVFVKPDKQQWSSKNAYINPLSCVLFAAQLHNSLASSATAALTQPMNFGESVFGERGRRENGCTIGELFSL